LKREVVSKLRRDEEPEPGGAIVRRRIFNIQGGAAMRSHLRKIGLAAAAAVAIQLGAIGSACATLNYTSQTDQDVTVEYADLPTDTQIVFVDGTSGVQYTAQGVLVTGTGSVTVSFTGLPSGQYYLLAQQSDGWVAQTVNFYF
jgi:hypothetical protein